MPALQKAKELRRSTSFCPQSFLLGHLRMSRFLEARLEEADARRSSFEKQARQIAQSTKELRRSTSSDIQRCGTSALTPSYKWHG